MGLSCPDGREVAVGAGEVGGDSSNGADPRRDTPLLAILPEGLVHLVAAGLVAATLYLVGQPIYANDTWIHLALGDAFASEGPWLEEG